MAGKLTHEQAVEMGKKGGRQNKGRVSPTTAAKIAAREALRRRIEEDMDLLYSAWKDSALGHFIEVKTPAGDTRVYRKAPNSIAIKDMFERAFGKPVQPIEGEVKVVDLSKRAQELLHELNIDPTGASRPDDDVPELDEAPGGGAA